MTRERLRAEDEARLPDGGPAGASSVGTDGEDADEDVSPEAAIERIRECGAEVRDSELETALAKLDAQGELSESDREAVADLADRLVDRLLAVPEASLREAADTDDDRATETALELFG